MQEATITAQASDGAEVVISGLLPEGAEATIEAVTLTEDELIAYFGKAKAAAMTGFVAYDIKIMVDGEEWQPDETVSVVVKQPDITVEEGESFAVAHVDSETEEVSDVSAVMDESGEVSFEADGFSIYIFYKFTVDFHFGETTFSIEGRSEILLSELFAELGVEFNAADAVSVTFSDETLLAVEQVEGDWLLTSLEAFDTYETLTIEFADGEVLIIDVTDAQIATLDNFQNGRTNTLTADVTANSTITITKDTTLDLNGHKITVASGVNPLFNVTGGTLTIKDSVTAKVSTSTVSSVTAGNKASYSTTNKALTYYVTETQEVNSDTGATQETLKRYQVTSGGMIIGSGNVRAITVSGGTVNLNGGYICNFNSEGLNNSGNGGAIAQTGGTVNLNKTVIAGNKGSDGGAIYVTGSNSKLNISGGVIAGNDATGKNHTSDDYRYGGGGIYIYDHATVNMTDGYVTNNKCSGSKTTCCGGGGIMDGGTLNLSGGYITGNTAPGGGGIMTYRIQGANGGTDYLQQGYTNGGKIYMTGGYVSGNEALKKEGGGITVEGYGYMSLTGGHVTNNECGSTVNSFGDWGGGGIFVSDREALLYIESVLVTENHAGGFGGGIAGCSTGRLNIAVGDRCANFGNIADAQHFSGAGNTKNEDHAYAADSPVFMENGYQDYYCALSSVVSGGMLGGGTSMWAGSVDGEAVTSNSRSDVLTAASVMGLTANPSDADKSAAYGEAKVFINGNESPTHGGGILVNGYLSIGPKEVESFCRLEFKATKKLVNSSGTSQSLSDKTFHFVIEDEFGKVVTTGTNSGSNITFNDRLAFSKAGTFTYYAYEKPSTVPGVVSDGTRYKIEVQIECVNQTLQVSPTESYTKHLYRFKNVKITQMSTGDVVYNQSPGNDEAHAVSLDPTGGKAFTNTVTDKVNIKVVKEWKDGGSHDPITVSLFRSDSNTPSDTQTLSSSNNWTCIWENLPTKDGTTAYTYSVKEATVAGYLPTYEVKTETVTDSGSSGGTSKYVEADTLKAGEKYIIVNSDGGRIMTANGIIGKVNKPSSGSLSGGYNASDISSDSILTAESGSNGGVKLKTADGQYLNSSSSGFGLSSSGSSYVVSNGSIKRADKDRYIAYYKVDNASNFRQRTSAPTGTEVVHLFKLVTSGGSSDTPSGTYQVTTITNTPVKDIDFTLSVKKVDEETGKKLLPNAEFELRDANNSPLHFAYSAATGRYTYTTDTTKSVKVVTANTGYIYMDKIPGGTYTLVETGAPAGYGKASPMTVTLDETTDGQIRSVTVEDPEMQYTLPETGGIGTAQLYSLGCLMVAGVCLIISRALRKREGRAD